MRLQHLRPFGLLLSIAAMGCGGDDAPNVPTTPDADLPAAGDGGRPPTDADVEDVGETDAAPDGGSAGDASQAPNVTLEHPTLLIVVDGLRPEWVTPELMPATAALAQGGASLEQHHATFPADPLVNAASLVTGARPSAHAIAGPRVYVPGLSARDVAGQPLTASRPLELSDVGTMASLDRQLKGGLVQSAGLLDAAADAGLTVALWGASGPTSLMNYALRHQQLDDHVASPLSWARAIAAANALKDTALLPPQTGALFAEFASARSPYSEKLVLALDPVYPNTSPPAVVSVAPKDDTLVEPGVQGMPVPVPNPGRLLDVSSVNSYLTYLGETFNYGMTRAEHRPDVAVVWLREPAFTALRYGPNSVSIPTVLEAVDGQINSLVRLAELSIGQDKVNIIITSGRGVAAVSADTGLAPRRSLVQASFDISLTTTTLVDPRTGSTTVQAVTTYAPKQESLSLNALDSRGIPADGRVRLAALLRTGGFSGAHDGLGLASGATLRPVGCVQPPLARSQLLTTSSKEFCVPLEVDAMAEPGAETIVVAQGLGEDLLYLPGASSSFVQRVAAFLMGRDEVGAVLVSDRFKLPAGALSMSAGGLDGARGRAPDMAVVYRWQADDIAGVPLRDATQAAPIGSGLFKACGPTAPCRPGLFCAPARPDASNPLVSGNFCVHCPKLPDSVTSGLSDLQVFDLERAQPGCQFDPDARLGLQNGWTAHAADRAGQRLAREGEFCDGPICEAGLVCRAANGNGYTVSLATGEGGSAQPGTCLKPGGKADAIVPDVPLYAGTSYTGSGDGLGTSGGGSPAELHTVFIASGPGFKKRVKSSVPSGTVDIAPTLAKLWGVPFEAPSGRVLHEVLAGDDAEVTALELEPIVSEPATDVPQYDPRSVKSDSTTRTGTKTFRTRITRAAVESDGKRYEYITSVGGTRE